jgi:hypothetical protein
LFNGCGLRSEDTNLVSKLPGFLESIATISADAAKFISASFGEPATVVLADGVTIVDALRARKPSTPYLLVAANPEPGRLSELSDLIASANDDDDVTLYSAVAIATEGKECHPVFLRQGNKWYHLVR